MSVTQNPRFIPLLMVVLGAAAVGIIIALGGMDMGGRAGGKAIFVVGIGGIAFGTGVMQLVWPAPMPTDARDERNFFTRASWPQKILYVAGGLAGIVAAAVLQTVVSGRY